MFAERRVSNRRVLPVFIYGLERSTLIKSVESKIKKFIERLGRAMLRVTFNDLKNIQVLMGEYTDEVDILMILKGRNGIGLEIYRM